MRIKSLRVAGGAFSEWVVALGSESKPVGVDSYLQTTESNR
ncbi:hypothetical protein [Pseudomonas sp. MAG733B]